MVPEMKNLLFWFRIWLIKKTSLGVCVYYIPSNMYFFNKTKQNNKIKPTTTPTTTTKNKPKKSFGLLLCRWLWLIKEVLHGMESSELTLANSPWVCANTDEKGGKFMTLKWQIPLYLHLQWLSGQEKESVNVLSKMTLTFEIAFIKVTQTAQTFNWALLPYHRDVHPALGSSWVLHGSKCTASARCFQYDEESGWSFPKVLSSKPSRKKGFGDSC